MDSESIAALALAKDTPCAKYSCRMRPRCAAEMLACDAWMYYVRVGTAVHPMMVIPQRYSRSNKPHMGDEIFATREKFDAAERDESECAA